MRGLISFLLFIAFFSLAVNSQTLHFEENFDYSAGTLTSVTANWSESPTGTTDIQIIEGNLTYSGYTSSNIGRKILMDGGASGRSGITRSFTSTSGDDSKVYLSFLLNVSDTSDMRPDGTDGDYFANFNGNAIKAYLYVRRGSTGASKFSIGIAKSSVSSLTYHSTELDAGTTYLIVLAYIFQSGDDAVKLWVDPSLSGPEPVADVEITSGSESTFLDQIQFRQRPKSGNMDIDGIRLSDTWAQAPLPVELTSFSAEYVNNSVQLNWETATETNNAGFEVQRQNSEPVPSEDEGWEVLTFIPGHGTTNSPKYYSYNDEDLPNADKVSYRLRQIDNDGTDAYSKTVEVELGGVTSVDDEMQFEFALEQNYPNPFNPVTTINFTLPNVGTTHELSLQAKLTVYNLLGQEVRTLVNDVKPAGSYQIQFDASDLPSGIYFYSLTYGNHIQTRKLALLK